MTVVEGAGAGAATRSGRRRPVTRVAILGLVVVSVSGLLVWALRAFGPQSVAFAFAVVWLPMVGLGVASRFVQPRLPRSFHRLRAFERDGRCYEVVGVRVAKRLLRRGPFAAFNPDLHLPSEPDAARIHFLEQRMCDAEASHAVLFMLTLGVVLHGVAQGWVVAAVATLLFDVLMNGYPVMLQRYNRALLTRRYPTIRHG